MEIFKEKMQMKAWCERVHKNAETICFVPTMGFFHQGHLSLMEKGKSLCDRLVVSIFINPTQFGKNEDFSLYPVDIEGDLRLAQAAGVDAVFLPHRDDMYPKNFQTYVSLTNLPAYLCGKFRPDHFRGVATVVTKLFNIIKPQVAVFGQKDFQQLQIIRRCVKDLDMDIEIVAGDIFRETDGLAMSSRNTYLSGQERTSALSLFKALTLAEELIENGQKNAWKIKKRLVELIESFDYTAIDYVSFCDPETLEEVDRIEKQVLLALAVKIGKTRLIDNIIIDPTR
jgi:pantoate--beta-alanine ligase